MEIAPDLLEQVVEHARRDHPNECCGVIAGRGGAATRVFALRNLQASPLRFEMGADLAVAMEDIDEAGDDLLAIYHSHTRSDPVPSQTDIAFAANWPGVLWLIVGLRGRDAEPDVRTWRIDGGVPEQV